MDSKILQFFNNFKIHSFHSPQERKAYEALVDQALYKSTVHIWTGIIGGILTYIALLFFKHNSLLHIWIIFYLLYYATRLFLRYLYTKSNLLSLAEKRKRFSSLQVALRGCIAGLVWVFLFYVVMQDYPVQSQIIGALAILIYTSATHPQYSSAPLWYLTYIVVSFLPICIFLAIQGGVLLWISLGIALYAAFMVETSYAYYMLHFNALLLQFQNERFLKDLRSSKKKIEETNIELKKTNEDYKAEILGRRGVEVKLSTLASRDTLTGLPNRVLLLDRINMAIIENKRDGKYSGILFIDLDRFKYINDNLGHHIGDKFLKAVSKRLKQSLREQDTVSRVGGDEFIILIPKLEKEKSILPLAELIKTKLSLPYFIEKHSITCAASIGISIFPHSGKAAEELIKNADIAMYQAKNKGGNRFLFFTAEMNYLVQRRIYIEECLRNALSKNNFILLYQPIINLKTNKIVGAEALLRMTGLKNELIMPMEFIPISEEIGLIYPIGLWVMEKICHNLNKWKKFNIFSLKVAINVSPIQVKSTKFIEDFKSILKTTKVDASCLEIEITESLAMEHKVHIIQALYRLVDLGVSISIDDFGTGHSSLSYLNKLPAHQLKIDRSFIKGSEHNEDSKKIIKIILSLAKALNLEVVAEGVETKPQLEYLKKIGCNLGQGNYFNKPLSEEELLSLLKTHKEIPL